MSNIIRDNQGKEYVEVDVETIHETDDAVYFTDGDNKFWIPKSVMDTFEESWPKKGEAGTVLVELWFAEKERLI